MPRIMAKQHKSAARHHHRARNIKRTLGRKPQQKPKTPKKVTVGVLEEQTSRLATWLDESPETMAQPDVFVECEVLRVAGPDEVELTSSLLDDEFA